MKADFCFMTIPILILSSLFISMGPMKDAEPETPYMSEKAVNSRYVVCIDPGHQKKGNNGTEPLGPGAATLKTKVSSGTKGKYSGMPEYELTLSVSRKLRDELLKRGYRVIMTRETNEVNISNAERAETANNAYADCFLRVHADGSDDKSAKGIMTICQTMRNPYNSLIYPDSRLLSEAVLQKACEKTGAKSRRVWETDTMTGINWSKVPVTIIEMGFMSNPEEDRMLASEEYQQLMAEGIADGTEAFFRNR